jgi:hypothetical protein
VPVCGRNILRCQLVTVRGGAAALRPLAGRPPFNQVRELVRVVSSECTMELDTNSYSVPWRLIGERVTVVASGGRVAIRHDGTEVAVHAEVAGRRQRVIDPAHLHVHGVTPCC